MNSALPEPVRRMIEATWAGDTDTFLSCFTADAYLEDWGRVFRGRPGVTQWNESDNIGQANQFTVTDVDERAGTWVIGFDATSRRRSGPGTLQITLDDNRISRFIVS